jgi:cysteine desulfuration protein SufE
MSEQESLPGGLQEIAEDFAATPAAQRLELLLEFSDELPELPQRLQDDPDLLEPVPECQSPIFVLVEVESGAEAGGGTVHLFFSAPPEAPTTRGFAGILSEGLDGHSVAEVLRVPADMPLRLSITDLVSPLRLNGMSGMLARIQRQVREKA